MGFKNTYLKKGDEPYFIAEIGINHNGQQDLARKMIEKSMQAGADAVKFQKREISYMLHPEAVLGEPTGYLSKDENDISQERKAYGTWVYPDKRIELSDNQFLELWEYSNKKGIDFLVSPWEESSVDFLANVAANPVPDDGIATGNFFILGTGTSLRNENSDESPPYLYILIFSISSLSNLKKSADKFI